MPQGSVPVLSFLITIYLDKDCNLLPKLTLNLVGYIILDGRKSGGKKILVVWNNELNLRTCNCERTKHKVLTSSKNRSIGS